MNLKTTTDINMLKKMKEAATLHKNRISECENIQEIDIELLKINNRIKELENSKV